MKNILTFSGLALCFLIALFLTNQGCQKDLSDPPQAQDGFAINDNDVIGMRLSIDSIKCNKIGDGAGGSDFELYGYIISKIDYSGNEISAYETTDESLLWFRKPEDWYRMHEGDILPMNKMIDYYINMDHFNQLSLNLSIGLFEYDKSNEYYGAEGPDDNMEYCIQYHSNDDETYEKIDMPIEYKFEEIEFYDPLFKKIYQVERFNETGSSHFTLYFSFHQISKRSDALLPEGRAYGEEFVEEDIYPDIPKSSSYTGSPSSNSKALVVGQKIISKFSPKPLMLRDIQSGPFGGVKDYYVYELNPKYLSGHNMIPPSFSPTQSDSHSEKEPWTGLVGFGPNFSTLSSEKIGPELQSKPLIQMVRYWVLTDMKHIPAGTTLTHEVSYKYGFSRNITNETTVKFGFESGFFATNFSMEVSNTFSISLTYDYEKTETSTVQISAPQDKNVQYATWQLVEEFRVVNDKGEIFTDPSYDFSSMTVVSIPTNHIVQEAIQFDAN